MAFIGREIYIRNHVIGVLVSYSNKGLHYSNMGELANSITDAVIESDTKWHEEYNRTAEEDVPQ